MARAVRLLLLVIVLIAWGGCGHDSPRHSLSIQAPIVRVRILQDQTQVLLSAKEPPIVRVASDPSPRRLELPSGASVALTLTPAGWMVGNVAVGAGVLRIDQNIDGTFFVNGVAYRGDFRFIPTGRGGFDVVNDLDIDSYLKGVVAREMLWNWDPEAYKAQAIAARTYALYEAKTTGADRYWDLYPDQRSQVYGGMRAETHKSRAAVESTAGVVLAYGRPGKEKIFKTYFSSCCGGVTQSAADAFGDAYMEPLSERSVGPLCSGSPRFNWGPVVIAKDELARRFKLWGQRRNRAEQNMSTVASIAIQAVNQFGRPTRFTVTDIRGVRYSWSGEELRWAVNTDAAAGSTLNSSFLKIVDDANMIRFVEGHGWGHGVGMCQWCAETRAERGMRHEDIALSAFPRAKLVRAY